MKKKILITMSIMLVLLIGVITGCAGADGIDGKDGVDGINGINGINGLAIDGQDGEAGVDGQDGVAGEKGDTGADGDQGIAGPAGDTGDTGPAGASGYGITGPKGDKGDTGPAGGTPMFTVALEVKTIGTALALTTTAPVYTGTYSAQLKTTGTVGNGEEARLVMTPVKPITLAQINTISWQEYLNAGYPPHVDILVIKADGTLEAIVIEYAHNSDTHYYDEAPMPYGAVTGAWYAVFNDDGNGPVVIDNTSFGWAATGAPGPYPPGGAFIGGSLADWKAGTIVSGVSGESQVINITIEVDNWVVQSDAYLDAVMVNGVSVWE